MDLRGKGSRQDGLSKTTDTQKVSSRKTSQVSRFMTTLQKLILKQFQRCRSSLEDSPAKISRTLVKELASMGVAVHSGNITPKLLGFYDRDSHSLKMCQRLLLEDSMLSLVTLPKSGMMRNGSIYQLPQLVRFTAGKEFLSWPTPNCADTFTDNLKSSQQKEGSMHSVTLSQKVQMFPTPKARDWKGGSIKHDALPDAVKMFPTPTSSDATTGSIIGKEDIFYQTKGLPRKINKNGKDFSVGLGRLVHIFPTPTTHQQSTKYSQGGKCLQVEVGGKLNPKWVEWLMGFPTGWTELSASETQSFRRSPKSLHKQSRRRSRQG